MIVLDPPWLAEDLQSGFPVILAAIDLAGSSCIFLACDIEGLASVKYAHEVRLDWRYDLKKKEWYDHSFVGREEPEDG